MLAMTNTEQTRAKGRSMERVRKQPRRQRHLSAVVEDIDVAGSTISDVMSWVGTDKRRAQQAWNAESSHDKARPSLLARLEARGAKS